MLRVMPHVAAEECFALKGGTAINLYVPDMPRLSVDIDLTYLPLEPRDAALAKIGEASQRIASAILRTVPRVTVQGSRVTGAEHISKLFVHTAGAAINISMMAVILKRGNVIAARKGVLPDRRHQHHALHGRGSRWACFHRSGV